MSYLIGKGRNNGRRTRPNSGSSLRQNRARAVTPHAVKAHQSKGGGQVLLQRPSQQPPIQSEKHEIDLRTLGVISMDEVMADLNILQQQQIESDQKLKQARVLKQRRVEQQVNLDKTLQQLKMRNGEQRAALESANETLSRSQRWLINSRTKSDGDGADLRKYDRKVKMAISIPPALVYYGRKHSQQLESIASMVKELERIAANLEDEYQRRKCELVRAERQDEEMRQSLRDQALLQNRIAKQYADARSTSRDEEDRVTLYLQQERSLKSQLDELAIERVAETVRHTKEAKLLSDRLLECDGEVLGVEETKRRLQEELRKATERFTDDWNATIIIQKSEGHPLSMQPSETTEPPVLDIDLMQLALDQEARAVSDELEAKEELVAAVASLRESLNGSSEAISSAESAVAEANFAVDELTLEAKESDVRRLKLSDLLEAACRTNEEKCDELEQVKDLNETRLESTLRQTALAKAAMEDKRNKLALIDDDVNSRRQTVLRLKATLQETKESNQKSLVELEKQFHTARQRGIELHNKFTSSEASVGKEQPILDAKSLTKYKQAVKIIKQAYQKYPKLKDVKLKFRPDLSHEEQAEADFGELLRSCKDRQIAAQRKIDAINRQEIERVAQEIERGADHPPAGENSGEAEPKSEKKQSAAKPRFLLPKFVDASKDPISSEDEGIPFESASSQQPNLDEQSGFCPPSQADKRVHWQDEDTNADDAKHATLNEESKHRAVMEFDSESDPASEKKKKQPSKPKESKPLTKMIQKKPKAPSSATSDKRHHRKHDQERSKLPTDKVPSERGSESKRRRLDQAKSGEGSRKSWSSKTGTNAKLDITKKKSSKTSAAGEASSLPAVRSIKLKSKTGLHDSRSLSSKNKSETTKEKSRKHGSKPKSTTQTLSSAHASSSSRPVSASKNKNSSLKHMKQESLKLALVGSSTKSKKRESSASREQSSPKKKARMTPTEQTSQKPSSKQKRPAVRRRRVGTANSAKSSRSLKDISFTFG